MDDIIILHHDKGFLETVKQEIKAFLDKHLRLQLNYKTCIRPTSMGIEFVGFRVWSTHLKLRKKMTKKLKKRLKYLFCVLAAGEIDRETLNRSIASYRGILQHFNGYGLRQSLNGLYIIETRKETGKRAERMESKRKEAKTEAVTPCRERKCYDCTNFYRDHFCGYAACNCKVFGSLDCDQKERHPDTTAATCPEYYTTTK